MTCSYGRKTTIRILILISHRFFTSQEDRANFLKQTDTELLSHPFFKVNELMALSILDTAANTFDRFLKVSFDNVVGLQVC